MRLATACVRATRSHHASCAEALTLSQGVKDALGPGCCVPCGERQHDVCLEVPAGHAAHVVEVTAKNPDEQNTAVEVYFQVGPDGDDAGARAALDLMDQALCEPVYDTLRTKEQLGYTVHSGARLTHGVTGFCVTVVSAKHGPK